MPDFKEKHMSRKELILSLGVVSLLAAGLTRFAAAEETDGPIPTRVRAVPVIEETYLFARAEGEEAPTSPYWIGVQLEPISEILKSHLNLEGGMVAVHVFDNSPAAKAGIKPSDIIVKAGDKYIKDPGDLAQCVGSAKETELTLVVLHGGKETAIKVTPTKRPQEENPQQAEAAESQEREAIQKLEAALNAYRAKAGTAVRERAVDLMLAKPGIVASTYAYRAVEVPKNVTIRITKEGGNPAKISVKRDDKEWEVTEDKLGELPDDIRGYVQQMRVGHPTAMAIRLAEPYVRNVLPQPVPPKGLPGVPAAPGSTGTSPKYRFTEVRKADTSTADSKLDQILKIVSQKEDSSVSALRKEVQQLRKELEELRQEKK
jgi:membrane-associated protease RseP (regulator of RpoE activity)